MIHYIVENIESFRDFVDKLYKNRLNTGIILFFSFFSKKVLT